MGHDQFFKGGERVDFLRLASPKGNEEGFKGVFHRGKVLPLCFYK